MGTHSFLLEGSSLVFNIWWPLGAISCHNVASVSIGSGNGLFYVDLWSTRSCGIRLGDFTGNWIDINHQTFPHISPKGQRVNIAMEMSYKQWPGLVCLFWCVANLPTRTFTHNQQPYPSYWHRSAWWRHQMEISSALLALCVGNSPVTVEFPAQMPVTRNFDVFFDLRLNKLLSEQSRHLWFGTPSRSLWRHCNGKMISPSLLVLFSAASSEGYKIRLMALNIMDLMFMHTYNERKSNTYQTWTPAIISVSSFTFRWFNGL